MKPLKVNPEYLALVPRPSKEEYAALERSIIDHGGCLEPIEVNERDEVLDGHTRFEICNNNSSGEVLFFDTKLVKLPSVLEEKLYIIEKNLYRRHLTDYEKIVMAKPLEEFYAEKARLQQGTRTDLTFPSNEVKVEPIYTAKEVAKAIGVSKATYERGKKIRDEGNEEEKQKARSKKRGVSSAYRAVLKRERGVSYEYTQPNFMDELTSKAETYWKTHDEVDAKEYTRFSIYECKWLWLLIPRYGEEISYKILDVRKCLRDDNIKITEYLFGVKRGPRDMNLDHIIPDTVDTDLPPIQTDIQTEAKP